MKRAPVMDVFTKALPFRLTIDRIDALLLLALAQHRARQSPVTRLRVSKLQVRRSLANRALGDLLGPIGGGQ